MLRDWQQGFAGALRQMPFTADTALLGSQAHRFAVYRDNMLGSLVEALGETFPVSRQLVGADFFDHVAADFVRREPPRAARLSRYGGALPAHLRALPHLHALGYVADVACYEWLRVETYFAGVAETTLSAETLLSQPAEALPHLVFVAAPSLRVISTPSAAHTIWLAHRADNADVSAIDPWQPEAVRLLCRPAGVLAERLSAPHAVFVQSLQAGLDLTSAVNEALTLDAGFDLQVALAAELAAGTFSGLGSRAS